LANGVVGYKKGQVSHYTGVFLWDKPTTLDYLMYAQLLNATAYFHGGACNKTSDCQTMYPEYGSICVAQQCIKGTTRFHYAYGTGLSNLDGIWQVVDSSKGTWTESVWKLTDVQISLKSSLSFQIAEFFLGVLVFVGSVGAVYGLGKYIEKRKLE
jgi:hypothetical protein